MNVNDVATPEFTRLMERKKTLERRLARAKLNLGRRLTVEQIAAKEAELDFVSKAIAADEEQFAQQQQQRRI